METISEQFGNVSTNVLANNCKHEASYISTLLPNGINTHGRPIAGIDWSRGEIIVNVENKPIAKFKTLAEAAPHYKGYIWVLESTADSFELQNRQIDLDAIKSADIWAWCFNPNFTSKYRIKWNDIPKSDESDSEVIRRIFTETKVTCKRFSQLIKSDLLREQIKKYTVRDRQYQGEESIAIAKKYLPKFEDTPEYLLEFIYKPSSIKAKKPKNPTPKCQIGRLLMICLIVREARLGFRTLRKQVGNYGQGYGCMARSEYYYWLVRIILNARMKKLGIKNTTKHSYIDPKTKKEVENRIWSDKEIEMNKQAMREMEKVLKWLWKLTV